MRDMNRISPLILAGLLALCLVGCAVTSTTPGRTDLKNQTLEEHREGKSGRRIRITVQPAQAAASHSAEEAQQ